MTNLTTGTLAEDEARDAELSPMQLAVLNAATDAPNVRRPTADFKVGDTVVISGSGIRNHTDSISKIGRMWITVGEGNRARRFDLSTLRSENRIGTGYSIRSRAQYAYDLMVGEAREQLSASGLAVNRPSDVSDGRLLAIAALLDLLDTLNPKPEGD
jgi:hypothetical protein